MEEKLLFNENELGGVFDDIKALVNESKNKIYKTINTEMLNLYWNIGKIIMEIQQGDERASYGETVLKKLSKLLALDEKSNSTLVPEGTFVPADIAIPSILKVK